MNEQPNRTFVCSVLFLDIVEYAKRSVAEQMTLKQRLNVLLGQVLLNVAASDSDKVKAHKYLAFIHCVSGRKRQCRDEFRKALNIIPSMELEAAEKGHPIWGPEFRSAKAHK